MSDELVRKWYAAHPEDEWNRMFTSPYRKLEFETTVHFLDKYLPAKGLVLDAGCGPGRYSIELAKRGYDVVMLDLASENLAFAKRKLQKLGLMEKVKGLVAGSVEDLSAFPSESFDAVLCVGGPLSHIMDADGRSRAASELVRVAKTDAPIFVAVINKFSALVYELRGKFLLPKPDGSKLFRLLTDKGDHTGKYVFTAFHGFLPEELRGLFDRPDVNIVEMVGLQGFGAHQEADVNRLSKDKRLWKLWLEAHYKTCTHPAVVGMSEHELLIGRKTTAF